MGLKIETWNIAFRKRNKECLFDKLTPFKVIKNGYKGWYADPFLFDYNGETYLFAEYFSYKLGRGVLSFSKYDEINNKFSPFQEIINESFHLSYPVVFKYDNNIYMMPESSESSCLYLYKAVSFPDKWERLPAVFSNAKLVDTTPMVIDGKLYALTLKLDEIDHSKGELLLLEFNGNEFVRTNDGIITSDMSIARPGGNFIRFNSKLFRISQDCDGSYGKAVNVIQLSENYFDDQKERLMEKISPEEINLTNDKVASGIHTYNLSEKLEVIDLKYYKNSVYHLLAKFYRLME